MTDEMRKLVALGASAAANCRPCLEHHLADAHALQLAEEDIASAIEVGLQVNQGAGRQTRSFVEALLAGAVPAGSPAPASGRGCC